MECKYQIVFDWIEIRKNNYRRNCVNKNTQTKLWSLNQKIMINLWMNIIITLLGRDNYGNVFIWYFKEPIYNLISLYFNK